MEVLSIALNLADFTIPLACKVPTVLTISVLIKIMLAPDSGIATVNTGTVVNPSAVSPDDILIGIVA